MHFEGEQATACLVVFWLVYPQSNSPDTHGLVKCSAVFGKPAVIS